MSTEVILHQDLNTHVQVGFIPLLSLLRLQPPVETSVKITMQQERKTKRGRGRRLYVNFYRTWYPPPLICADVRGIPPMLLILIFLSLATTKVYSVPWPFHGSTEGGIRPLVCHPPKETPHCCRVTLLKSKVFKYAKWPLKWLTNESLVSDLMKKEEEKKKKCLMRFLINFIFGRLPRKWCQSGESVRLPS